MPGWSAPTERSASIPSSIAARRNGPAGCAAATAAGMAGGGAEHQAGPFRRAAMDEGIDAERSVGADQPGIAPLEGVESRPPHQRSVGENPQAFAALFEICVHLGRK